MKKIVLMMVATLMLNSCSESEEFNSRALILENIKKNSFVLDKAFEKTAQILQDQGNLGTLVSVSNSRDAFITKMNDLVNDVVTEVIEAHGYIKIKVYIAPSDVGAASHHALIQTYLKPIPFGIDGPNPGSGALDLYSKEIDNKIDAIQEIILVASHQAREGQGQGKTNVQDFSIVHRGPKLGVNTQESDDILVNDHTLAHVKSAVGEKILSFTGQELDQSINDFVEANPDTEILVGLLLPAVQKIKLNHTTQSKSSYQKFSDLIFGTQISPERTAWDQQVRYAAFLAGFDYIISDDYRNDDPDFASVPLQGAMHHAACVLMWSKIYDIYK